ncbi:hypothetical protein J8385_20410, partial [Acinetobacter baumannii]|nr:hypothetical protein [Acinetobacter baumannii]
AYMGDFDTYIFDEPTSGVDVESALTMLQMITIKKNKGAGILLTSHNIDELEEYSDYIYFLDDNHLLSSGTVAQFTHNNSSLYIMKTSDLFKTKYLLESELKLKVQLEEDSVKFLKDDVDTNKVLLLCLQHDINIIE